MSASPPEPSAPPPRQVPLGTRILFGSGSIAEGTKNTAFNVFLLFYYNNVLGLSGTLSGLAIFLALCVDAVTDPLVGSISDNFRSRWGRRHPFMYASAMPMAICFYLLFNPPGELDEQGLFLWFTAFAIGVRVFMTLYSIPSNAMVPELTTNYDERTGLVSVRFLFGWVGGIGVSAMGYFYFFATVPGFEDGRLNPAAYGAFALFSSLLIFLAISSCSVGTHRLIPKLHAAGDEGFSLPAFLHEVRLVLQNRSYVVLLGAALFSAVAGGFNDVVGLYVNTYFWEFSSEQIGTLLLPVLVGSVIGFALTPTLTARSDKRTVALRLAVFGVFFGPITIYLRLLGLMPENGSPLLLPVVMGHACLIVAAIVGIGIATSSMIADIVDEGELLTGKRQEGMFVSAIAFTAKATSGLGGLVAGIALDVIAFPRGADVGAVPPDKVFALGLAVGPALMIFYLLALFFLSRYRITRERHAEILAALDARG